MDSTSAEVESEVESIESLVALDLVSVVRRKHQLLALLGSWVEP